MMTNQQILEKAMLKAHKNGWNPLSTIDWVNVEIERWDGNGMVGVALLYNHKSTAVHWVRELEGIIYNHDFAKALWGGGDYDEVMYEWKRNLQQMVIADDPIQYLGEAIDNKL